MLPWAASSASCPRSPQAGHLTSTIRIMADPQCRHFRAPKGTRPRHSGHFARLSSTKARIQPSGPKIKPRMAPMAVLFRVRPIAAPTSGNTITQASNSIYNLDSHLKTKPPAGKCGRYLGSGWAALINSWRSARHWPVDHQSSQRAPMQKRAVTRYLKERQATLRNGCPQAGHFQAAALIWC